MSVIDDIGYRYERTQRRARRRRPHERFDIQGLRMVAVLTVFANHLSGWPQGGFVGVDVFFVISGFLITGGLLRTFDKTGSISFTDFYRRRFKRIVPAAALVLAITCAAAAWAFFPTRAHSTYLDAFSSLTFWSNWRFAADGTDYFTADGPISPLRHFWSLSIEEQFYFVWPLVILLVGLLALRRRGSNSRASAALLMGVIVVASFLWSVYETSNAATWAYFNTFARIWELGVGALLAICAGAIGPRFPEWARIAMSYTGLAAIVAAVFIVPEGPGFPAPWASLPVAGATLVIVAGIGREPRAMPLLTNPVSRYIGHISYSLYLWHWPVIVVLAAVMQPGTLYYVAVLGVSFAGAILSFHLVEDPIRNGTWAGLKDRLANRDLHPHRATQYGALAGAALLLTGVYAYAVQPPPVTDTPTAAVVALDDSAIDPAFTVGASTLALQRQIATAATASRWPDLSPSMDSAINGPQVPAVVSACGGTSFPSLTSCTWGATTAPRKLVVVGDSVALTYVNPLRLLAERSGGAWQVHNEAMFGCAFTSANVSNSDQALARACPGRKQHAVDVINQLRPDVVVVVNTYEPRVVNSVALTPTQWASSLQAQIAKFSPSTGRVVLLAPPPSDVNIKQCYTRTSTPMSCMSRVVERWRDTAGAERQLAAAFRGAYIDSRSWFCTPSNYCPAFVGTTPTKVDQVHMTPEYGEVIAPAIGEALSRTGVLATR